MSRKVTRVALLTLGLLLALTGCAKKPDTLVGDYNQEEMDRAIARARERVGEFIDVLSKGEADSFSVKAPVTDSNGTEHFWITDVTFADGEFSGLIGNDPGVVENVTFGQKWTVKKEEISDWMYVRGEKIHGGFTIDPLLAGVPKEEADAMRSRLVRD